jgi:hypothetical protein
MTGEPDFVRAKEKITQATNWRGDVNVSLGDETVTFKHRLLNENEFLNLKQSLNLSEVEQSGNENVGQTEAQERLLELQQKEDLSDDEEDELAELSREVAQQSDEIEDALGEDGYDKLLSLGRDVIEPSKDDIDYVYEAPPDEAKRLMGVSRLPNPLTKEAIRRELKGELADMISEQPYPIKINVGMQAFSETISVLGNGLEE